MTFLYFIIYGQILFVHHLVRTVNNRLCYTLGHQRAALKYYQVAGGATYVNSTDKSIMVEPSQVAPLFVAAAVSIIICHCTRKACLKVYTFIACELLRIMFAQTTGKLNCDPSGVMHWPTVIP